jgi:hypothetical protein
VAGTATAKVRVYAVNYNVLRVMSGMAGVASKIVCMVKATMQQKINSAEKQHATHKQAMWDGNFGLAPVLLASC